MSNPLHILLLGAGHAHVEVLRQAARRPIPNTRLTLVSPQAEMPYSGLLPALLRDEIAPSQAHLNIARLAQSAHATFLPTRAVALDPAARRVLCANGALLGYDLLSLNIGGTQPTPPGPAIPVKPIAQLLARLPPPGTPTAIIGAGAAGTELALALRRNITLIGPRLLPQAPPRARRLAATALAEAGIPFIQAKATGFDGTHLQTTAGPIAAQAALWATPIHGPRLLAASGLPCDASGCLETLATLQSSADPTIFAAGDCAATPHPKAGVWAVRAGPTLAENLRRAATNQSPLPWTPPPHALAILGTGNGQAIAWRNGLTLSGPWVARWKTHLDQAWLRKYQSK